jgi:predicted aspartyl protease
LVNVQIDGADAPVFLLDTGSDVSAIDRRLQERLKLPTDGKAEARGSGGLVSTEFVRAGAMSIGSLHVDRPVLLVLDLAGFDAVVGTRVGGIVGLDALEGIALRINYPARAVEVAPSGGFVDSGAPKLPLRRRDNLYGIDVSLGGDHPTPLLLDTGMTGALSLEIEAAYREGLRPDPQRRGELRVGIGGASRSPLTTVPWVGIAGRDIGRVELVLDKPAGRFPGAIGGSLLRFFCVTADFGARTIQLDSEPSLHAFMPEGNASGMRLDFRFERAQDGVRVDAVRANSPADLAGLRAGDLLTEIDGEPIAQIGWRRLREWMNRQSVPKSWTVLARDGSLRKVVPPASEDPARGPGE